MHETKTCFKCGEVKSLSDFYKHKQMADGHLNKCKGCTKTDTLENKKKREDYYHAYDRERSRLPHRKQAKKDYASREYVKEALRESRKRSAEKHWRKRQANNKLSNAIRDGRVIKQPCFMCGCTEVQGHHPDYDAPLDVVWLCTKHHGEIHRKYDEEYNIAILSSKRGNRWDTAA